MLFSREDLKKVIHKSQHCQRNWDLEKFIADEDLDLLTTAASQCPSKQNMAYYKLHFVLNREIIEKIHSFTDGFIINFESGHSVTNSQVLANLLVVFEPVNYKSNISTNKDRNVQTYELNKNITDAESLKLLERDQNMAVGIAAGYLNLTASILGYSTGCCACFDPDKIKETLNLESVPLLLMGIGYDNENLGRRVHHKDNSILFPTKNKEKIEIKIHR